MGWRASGPPAVVSGRGNQQGTVTYQPASDLGLTTDLSLILEECNDILTVQHLIGTSNIGQRSTAQHSKRSMK